VRGWTATFPEDKLLLNIPPGTQTAYEAIIENTQVEFIEDPVVRSYRKFREHFEIIRYPVGLARRIHPILTNWFEGPRLAWAKQTEKMVEATIYPFQRDRIIHFNKPKIYVMHDFYDFEVDDVDPRFKKIQTSNLKLADAIITSWPGPFQTLQQLFPERKQESFMVPFTFEALPSDEEVLSSEKERMLVYASATGKHKNHENLVLALGILKRRGVDKVRVVCPGSTTRSRMKIISKIIAQEEVEDWLEFPGFITREKLRELYKKAAGVVTTTRYEAFSGTVLEGLQYAKPIACSRIHGITKFIDLLDINVRYFDPDSPHDIANAIIEIIENPEPYQAAAKAARSKLRLITPKETARQYREILQWLLGNKPRPKWFPHKPFKEYRKSPPNGNGRKGTCTEKFHQRTV
jgi:glycosyltransferase involved in cell wall biosynthesis